LLFNSVARVLCALEQKIFLRPQSIKTTEFEIKNSCKNLEDANLFFSESNKPHLVLEMNFDKVVIVGWRVTRLGAELPAAGG